MQSRSTAVMTDASFRELYDQLRGSVPWPPHDRRGALNYLGPEQVRAAAAGVTLGRTVSLAAPVESQHTADNPHPARHPMTGTADQAPAAGLSFATDRVEMNVHGNADSHLDALCHVMYDGHLYNGVPAGRSARRVPPSCPSTPSPTASPAGVCCSTSPGCAGCPGWSRANT